MSAHGTHATYCNGCRCDACKEGHRRYAILRDLAPAPLSVDSTGTSRRIQALSALGWSYSLLAERLGVTRPRVGHLARRVHTHVTRAVHDQVAGLYDDLCMTLPPDRTKGERYAIVRAKAAAAEKGWVPPLAWDDIDTDPAPIGVRTDNTTTVDLDEWLNLVTAGEDPTRAARRLGVTVGAIARNAERHNRPDIIAIASTAAGRARRTAA